jgi:hypothetical protein
MDIQIMRTWGQNMGQNWVALQATKIMGSWGRNCPLLAGK